jgi:hypothetical protein
LLHIIRFGKVAEAPSNYWKVFSVNALNNARTYAQLRTFEQQPGVVGYRIIAVRDGKTSNICQALDNRVFKINQALQRFDQMFQAQSLDELRTLSPMVQGSSGKGFHYDLGGGAGKQALDVDNYQGLLSAGISFPPFHFNCRSSIEPLFGMLDWEKIEDMNLSEEDKGLLREMEKSNNFDDFVKKSSGFSPFEVGAAFLQEKKGQAKTWFMHSSYQKDAIEWTEFQTSLMVGASVAHSHPTDTTLGSDDIAFGLNFSLSEMTASSPRFRYSMTNIPNLDRYVTAEFIESQRYVNNEFYYIAEMLKYNVENGTISAIEAGSGIIGLTNILIAEAFGFEYKERLHE